jgi:hypothetical protein
MNIHFLISLDPLLGLRETKKNCFHQAKVLNWTETNKLENLCFPRAGIPITSGNQIYRSECQEGCFGLKTELGNPQVRKHKLEVHSKLPPPGKCQPLVFHQLSPPIKETKLQEKEGNWLYFAEK